jgi:hypothetical protein
VHRKDARRVRREAAPEKARITPIRDLAAQPTLLGVTTHQGERESRSQDEGAQVLTIDNDGEVREMRNATTVLTIIHYEHWRAGCPESGHVRCAP